MAVIYTISVTKNGVPLSAVELTDAELTLLNEIRKREHPNLSPDEFFASWIAEKIQADRQTYNQYIMSMVTGAFAQADDAARAAVLAALNLTLIP